MELIKNLARKNIIEMSGYSSARNEFAGVAEVFLSLIHI